MSILFFYTRHFPKVYPLTTSIAFGNTVPNVVFVFLFFFFFKGGVSPKTKDVILYAVPTRIYLESGRVETTSLGKADFEEECRNPSG